MRYEYWIETEDKRECRYWMVIESCSRCLFETLCRLEKQKSEQVLDPNQI